MTRESPKDKKVQRKQRQNPDSADAKARSSGARQGWDKERVGKWILIVCGPILVICVIVAIPLAIRQNKEKAENLASFEKEMPEYLAAGVSAKHGAPLPKFGKAVAVDLNNKTIDKNTYLSLPGELRAANASEVATVVQIVRFRQEQVGTYDNRLRAMLAHYKVTVIDRSTRVILGTTEIRGLDPPKTIPRVYKLGEDIYGGLPTGDIVAYVQELAKK